MKRQHHIALANLDQEDRQKILSVFLPKFSNVYCFGIVWAYKVHSEYDRPLGRVRFRIYGRHTGNGHEALVGELIGQDTGKGFAEIGPVQTRPDGLYLRITLSTDDGVAPGFAGDIDPLCIEACEPIEVDLEFKIHPMHVQHPDRQAA